MLSVYERLFDVKYNFTIFRFILIGYAVFCSTTQLMTKSTESFIATRHDSHAHYVMKALKAGKHVFTEKPLCLTEIELSEIAELLNSQNLKELSADNTNQRINQSTNQRK